MTGETTVGMTVEMIGGMTVGKIGEMTVGMTVWITAGMTVGTTGEMTVGMTAEKIARERYIYFYVFYYS